MAKDNLDEIARHLGMRNLKDGYEHFLKWPLQELLKKARSVRQIILDHPDIYWTPDEKCLDILTYYIIAAERRQINGEFLAGKIWMCLQLHHECRLGNPDTAAAHMQSQLADGCM